MYDAARDREVTERCEEAERERERKRVDNKLDRTASLKKYSCTRY